MVRMAVPLLLCVFVAAPFSVRAQSTADAYAQNQEEAKDIKDDITKLQKKLEQASQKKKALEGSLTKINTSLNSTLAAIGRTQALLRQTTDTIKRKELEVALLEENIQLKKDTLGALMQEMYFNADKSVVEIMLGEDEFSRALDEAQSFTAVEERVQGLLDDLQDLKGRTEGEKANLEELKKSNEEALAEKAAEKRELAMDQAETQADIAEQEKAIGRLKKELNELQGDLAKILGKSYNAKDIEDAVNFASKASGVPKGFLIGVLKMETNLGANVGGCTYAEVEDGAQANYKSGRLSKRAWNTFQWRRDLFKGIANELDIDYRKQKVSCNPKGYAGTGGAMGVAQFMPDTWNGYKSQVASVTGHNPPSPWNLTDGVTAMALKLKKTPGVTGGNRSAMKSAACSYLGTCYAPYINGILYWADHYQELLK
jgi:peptidoglycan hydrolase CwlO-like protein